MNQTSHELQVAASVSGLVVKGALPAPGAIMRAESELTKSGPDPLVSLLTPSASRFVDDQLAQHSGLGRKRIQNLLVTGGTFVSLSGSLCVNNFTIIVHRSRPRTIMSIIPLLILAKCRRRSLYPKNQTPVHCLPDGKIYWTNLGIFLFIVLTVGWCRGVLVSSGEWEGLERPRSVSSSWRKCLTGKCLHVLTTLNSYSSIALVFHMCSGLMPPPLRVLQCHSRAYPV